MDLSFRHELCQPKRFSTAHRTNESRYGILASGGVYSPSWLDDVPDVFHSIAELTTCYASAQAVVADADSVIHVHVCKIVLAFGHGADEDANALFGTYVIDVVLDPDDFSVVTEGDLSAIGRKMVCDGILDDLEELFL